MHRLQARGGLSAAHVPGPRVAKSAAPHRERRLQCAAATLSRPQGRKVGEHSYTPPRFVPEQPPELHLQLESYDAAAAPGVDVVIAGAGPAGLAAAARIAQAGFDVTIVDPNPLVHWPNNYGVWSDEFEAMNLGDCFEIEWSKANVWLGDDSEKLLTRRYARVDRTKLKKKIAQQCVDAGVRFHYGRVESCQHEDSHSVLKCQDGTEIKATIVVDATGHSRRLVEFDQAFDPGYQIAYGIMAEVDSHPFDLDTMLFMDWRDGHTKPYEGMRESNSKLPTFLYAMPFTPTRVFLEETSLVGRPAISFDEVKQRLFARLDHMNIKVNTVVEEEYCLIPMGGVLPQQGQRVIGVGGTAGLVHPSTGYMVARTLGAVPQLADRIVDELSKASDKCRAGQGVDESAAKVAAVRSQRLWEAMWPLERLQQREFFNMGMEILLKLDLQETRQFFTAFFGLSDFHWQGFLSSRLSLVELLQFGLALFFNANNATRLNLVGKGLPGLVTMAGNLLRLQTQGPPGKKALKRLR